MPSSVDVAKFFLAQSNEEAGDLVSNLKLQKLVYYAQGFHLAVYDQPLFDDVIEAWTHGPVVPTVYHHYKAYGSGSIPAPADFNLEVFRPEQVELLNEVQQIYGQYSAWRLREMTHEEAPWRDHFKAGEMSREIPAESMQRFFKTLVN
ncbi:phage-associated protein [Pseudomonas knackmussii B13]|uniref:Phage-associated protein n=1 Tax=Pseudomonas knackmussii (strain DSM 6978 / CCUG 54928 / LMG 23759 / B13) TaxID=1301098 RepID=A0A024HPB2_PSEKB|nr:type II toxin-antitoxin system antitoxin SocA domain-containing protein [Pseudomonas knackmussii]CDF86372.1 phage-associated protein [Pseudomonas knackmussii B13]